MADDSTPKKDKEPASPGSWSKSPGSGGRPGNEPISGTTGKGAAAGAAVSATGAVTSSSAAAPREHMSEPYGPADAEGAGWLDRLQTGSGNELSERIDQALAQVPPVAFFGGALVSLGLAAGLTITGERKGWATFFGALAPSVLFLGVYSRLGSMQSSFFNDERHRPTVH